VTEVRFSAGIGNSSPCHRVQTGSGAHSGSHPMGTRGSFPMIKRLRGEADHSSEFSAEVKNAWSYTSTPQYVFKACCLVQQWLRTYGVESLPYTP